MENIKTFDNGLGSVELQDVFGNDLAVINAARVSYGKSHDILSYEDMKLIEYLAKHKHYSPFRHCFLKFRIDMPEFVARQFYKHTIGSTWGTNNHDVHAWNEISGRYTSSHINSDAFYFPKEFRAQSKVNKQVSVVSDELDHAGYHSEIIQYCLQGLDLYNDLISEGVAREQARMVLPVNLRTQVIWTASLQAVAHFISLRNKPESQYEIQVFADAIQQLTLSHFPYSVKALLDN